MRVSEFAAWGALLGLGVWCGTVAMASLSEKPVATCRPVVWAAGALRAGLTAIQPGSSLESAGNALKLTTARWCLAYTANLFEVTQTLGDR